MNCTHRAPCSSTRHPGASSLPRTTRAPTTRPMTRGCWRCRRPTQTRWSSPPVPRAPCRQAHPSWRRKRRATSLWWVVCGGGTLMPAAGPPSGWPCGSDVSLLCVSGCFGDSGAWPGLAGHPCLGGGGGPILVVCRSVVRLQPERRRAVCIGMGLPGSSLEAS